MIYIQEVKGREILESRGLPTIEVEITLSNGLKVISSSPAGTSYSTEGGVEIRDKDMGRYHGFGVTRAVANVNKTIAPRLYKKDPLDQFDIDELLADLDGTPNKAHLGANSILAVSMAVAKAGALVRKQSLFEYLHYLYNRRHMAMFKKDDDEKDDVMEVGERELPIKAMDMPEPVFNLVEGRSCESCPVSFQDFMVILKGIPDYADKLRYASELDHQVKKNIGGKDYENSLMNQTGYKVEYSSDEQILTIFMKALGELESRLTTSVYFGIDIAADGLYNSSNKEYTVNGGKQTFNPSEYVNYLMNLSKKFPIIFYEDPIAMTDYKNWKLLKAEAPDFMGIVGDDLFSGVISKIQKNVKEQWANGLTIKPNQIGSVLDIFTTIITAQQQRMKIVLSHRSGETNDDFLSDLAVAVGAEYIKAGSPRRGERVAKYNRLSAIEEELKILKVT